MSLTQIFLHIIINSHSFVNKWGYLGIFIVSLVSSASIIFPVPSFVILFSFGAIFNPLLVAIVGALGASIGNTTSYILGLGGKEILEDKYEKKLEKIKDTFKKYGAPFWIILVNATPLPDDIVGIFCGIIRYDFRRYFLYMFIGEVILALLLSYSGYYSINWVLEFLQPRLGILE
ncbi:MAG: VTT domain-containing protein [Candidatus Aenigmarchaeota archaeon]|nr:VTT domain-containing protein [Candidatus Aenigmarchaeota archaeon]